MHACVFVAVTCFHIAANSSQKLGGFTDLEQDLGRGGEGGGALRKSTAEFLCVFLCKLWMYVHKLFTVF